MATDIAFIYPYNHSNSSSSPLTTVNSTAKSVMLLLNLLVLISIESTYGGNYNIYRSACRKYAVFKATDRNAKVKGGLISVFYVNSLPHCVRECLAVSNCLTFNFSPTKNQENCEILASSKSTDGTLVAATSWNHYEALSQQVSSRIDSSLFEESLSSVRRVLLASISH